MATQEWATKVFEKIDQKLQATAQRNVGKIPYVAVDGVYDDMNEKNIAWWTNGFFAGELWQMYKATQQPIYKKGAEKIEELLDRAFVEFEGLHHDVGFM